MENMWDLRRSKATEILFALTKGPKHIRELQSEVGGSAATVEARVKELLASGLLRERKLESWPFRRELELTEKGREIVRIIELQGSLLSLAPRKPSEKRERWILAMLYALGGRVRGRLRLQKLMFLLKHELGVKLPYRFIPYMYGPYSADIFEDLAALRDEGLVEIRVEELEPREMIIDDKSSTTTYSLTSQGRQKAREAFDILPPEVKRALATLRKFNRMRTRNLLRYVYEKYPKESLGA